MAQTVSSQVKPAVTIDAVHGIRYQVSDVARAVAFYTQHCGFTLKHQQPPAFANVSLGGVDILLSGPGASGSRPMPNGAPQTPENEMEVGPGGRQIQIEDPDGNPLELFEPASRA